MKLTLLTPALAAILGLALASALQPIHAQTTTTTTSTTPAAPMKPASTHARGTLTAVDTAGNTVTVDNKKDGSRTFSIASTATITLDKKPATLADFAVGDMISITYTTDASGTLTATKLSAMTPKVKPATTPSATTTPSAPATTTTSTQ